jgi:cellulose synthase/poly-beta-1,6-N-acetylglucosamine synthase-like glycosyltransferase
LPAETQVLVFVDSDVRVSSNWLRSLVAPLRNPDLGATTGYRWFSPETGGFASQLRSVWNASIASALGENTMRNFCWGGSTGIRRSVFEELKVRDHWRGSVSDDFTITHVLQRAKRPIFFVAECLVPTFEGCSLTELLVFTNRQLQITRVYAPHLWKPLFIGSALFVLTFFGGLALVATEAISGPAPYLPASIILLIFVLGAVKSFIRFQVVDAIMERHQLKRDSGLTPHLLLWPVSSLLQLINCIVAGLSRRIRWRGITYELKSPDETVIIDHD